MTQHTFLRDCGRSLCIIDEFGKGTLTSDGVGLLCATLRRFAAMSPAPKVITCTHFSEVLDATLLPRRSPEAPPPPGQSWIMPDTGARHLWGDTCGAQSALDTARPC